MTSDSTSEQYIAFLRGINVGGHHKVPMADLRSLLSSIGCAQVTTLLNSGNIIFHYPSTDLEDIEVKISKALQEHFGFAVPTIIRSAANIRELVESQPFAEEQLTSDKRFYVSFFRHTKTSSITPPWSSEDNAYQILEIRGQTIISVLDLSISKTPAAMKALEQSFGKGVTTRNWNTIVRIITKL